MDGTFIPLDGNEQNRHDLIVLAEELLRRKMELVYVTGRHYELVCDAIKSHQLPQPRWLICDVGSSIYQQQGSNDHRKVDAYSQHLDEKTGRWNVEKLAGEFKVDDRLRKQEPEKQGPHKLSYYCDAGDLKRINADLSEQLERLAAPYQIIASVDPFTGDGLIDFLPRDVSKAYALDWWVDHVSRDKREVIFAGDSGNDLAAMTAGYRCIVVGNADRELAAQVQQAHQQAGWQGRLLLANGHATSGVLEGVRYFG